MVEAYTLLTVIYLAVWQYHALRLVRISFRQALADTAPFFLASATVMVASYYIIPPMASLVMLLVARVTVAVVLYVAIMKVFKVKLLSETIQYIKNIF